MPTLSTINLLYKQYEVNQILLTLHISEQIIALQRYEDLSAGVMDRSYYPVVLCR